MTAMLCAILISHVGAATCKLPDATAGTALDYAGMKGFVVTEGDELFARFAPVVLVENYEASYNRIGTPSARLADDGSEDVHVDPSTPTYYVQKLAWKTDAHEYTNLVYRVHFALSKSNDNSRDGGNGENVGLLVVVTVDENGKPCWVNTVGTCGCFHAVLPTTFTPDQFYPEHWDKEDLRVYGEKLPGMLAYPEEFDETVRPVVYLRDGSHRVADLAVASIASIEEKYPLIHAKVAPMEQLKHLPLGDGETSFYYEEGSKKGLVKGAYKRREALLLGALVGDGRVGQDRIYASEDEVPRGFYTTINPLDKSNSDMWDYKAFLKQDGWKL